ncbi:MAG: DUF2997 domain-containing protein [Candidatus Aminicenantes bacterium]|nr:DUF2997 domain-containing protein [Candidatus Aminicenantes bacterium]
MEEIIVTIQGGDVKVEVEGIKGARCLELTQAIEILLGEINGRQLKDDFYGQIEVKRRIYLKNILQKE